MKILLAILVAYEVLALIIISVSTLFVRRVRFWLVQMVNAQLMPIGWVVCLWPNLAHFTWIFWNDDDPPWNLHWRAAYLWLAWRNPVDNFKHVGWTQADGPLYYRTWWRGQKQYYFKAGWMSDRFCALSAGSGRGY